jgi:hypothetical protein
MNKVLQYVRNVALGAVRMPLSVIKMYTYHPADSYIQNVLVTFDCFCNALALGDPDETISSRCAKAQLYEQAQKPPTWGGGCRMCSFLAFFQENHCGIALERNEGHMAIIKDAPIPPVEPANGVENDTPD